MQLRVAIVGAGPAGIYAADSLLKQAEHLDVSIDLFERLPAPFGLVRYGVAPDHPRIKGIVSALQDILDTGRIRLFGNVNYGTDITLEDLKRHYHAAIFATGAVRDAELDIPGIELPGSFGAADFVSWYDGHPDVSPVWPLDAKEVAVIGNGNVALDVARILVKRPEDLYPTEIPDHVYETLSNSPVTDVHVIGRRAPWEVKFTPLELRELGDLEDVDIMLDPSDFEVNPASLVGAESNKQQAVIRKIFAGWLSRPTGQAPRRLHFHFFARPDALEGSDLVERLRLERMDKTGDGALLPSGSYSYLDVGAVYRAVGYFGSLLAGLPFDEALGVIPNQGGQVISSTGETLAGLFVTGWIKRGPVGLIGHTKSDAMETIASLLEAQSMWWSPEAIDADAIPRLLRAREVVSTSLEGWGKLDTHERHLGRLKGKSRLKATDRSLMLDISSSH